MTKHQLDQSQIIIQDPGQVGASLDFLANQIEDGWRQSQRVTLPARMKRVNRVAVLGMGGSHLGPDIVRSVFANRLKVPVTIIADYALPGWVNAETLVMAASYSGSTEETITAVTAAQHRGGQVVVITSGGVLASWAQQHRVPLYQFVPAANPSGQPRLGLGYSLMAFLACWRRLGLLAMTSSDVTAMIKAARQATSLYGAQVGAKRNTAKHLALQIGQKIPVLIGAEWTAGNLHTWSNQINENAKTFAAWYLLPDLNHHLLEGLRHRSLTKQMVAVTIHDSAYLSRNHQRLLLTEKILEQQGGTVAHFTPLGKTALAKAVSLLAFGGYVSWYLAAVRQVEPADIPTVNFLKAQLAKKKLT